MNKNDIPDISDLITQSEAARLRNVSRHAIYELVERGRLTTHNIGGQKFVSRTEVLNFEKLPGGRPSKSSKKHSSKKKTKPNN
jgi:excisionase family DNA binding protein